MIANNTYGDLGQLSSKKVGNNTQNINFAYNVRGWLTDINNTVALKQETDPKDLFALKINYDKATSGIAGVKALYNGNISETSWATNSDNGIARSYGYKYDNLNRLKEGIFQKAAVTTNAYNEILSYDKNGNIMGLSRIGSSESATAIDALVYTYANNSTANQLVKVTDSSLKNLGFTDGTNTGDDYVYDLNGNMISDANKNITAITYNHLNLPTKITFATTGNIVYIYNATGQKLQKIVNETGKTAVTTDYLGGYQYDNNVLKFIPTAEGYAEPSGSSYQYIYQYKDHLGNVCLSYDKTLAIKEESNYYPFGLKHNGYNPVKVGVENKYKYNGKELQDELSLNLYDYGARNYDPTLGRWMNIDPLAEMGRRWSPYNYGLDNPLFFIDPDGMLSESFMKKIMNSESGTTWTNNNNGTFTSSTTGETTSDGETSGGIDPPSKKKVEDMTPAEKNEYWRKYNEEKLLPLNESLINFAFIADGAGALSELFTVKASFKLTSLTGIFKNLLNKASRFTVDSPKFDYFFGRVVTGNEHNIQRSAQNLADLTTLGIKTEKELMKVFNKAWNSPIIQKIETSHGVSVIKSASVGKRGQAIQVSFFYKGGDMSLTPTVSTIIPKL
ncbi:RHS repeat-associated core domain-containing protein [Flavobacterium tructae]|uniref:RHS repeat-associated core domain-containing protein n=1 Tax=Flavobacterium tructae TaxID=1114873 RepID=UPI0035A97260